MSIRPKSHAAGKVKPGDLTRRVGVEQVEARGVDVQNLLEKLIDAASAEFTTYDYYTILRMYLAGYEDYKEICEDARLEDWAHFELITPRIYELGGSIPYDIREFADRAWPAAYLPDTGRGKHPPEWAERATTTTLGRAPPRSLRYCWRRSAALGF